MSTNNNEKQQTNINRSSYVHLLAGGYENREKEYVKYIIFLLLVLPEHLVLY
jgi:hypothetical protein